jgi:hypothetical protein
VDVVEHDHHRSDRGQPFEQFPYGAMTAVTLVNEYRRAAGGAPGQSRKDPAELHADVVVQRREATGLEPPQVVLERVDEHPERQIALELCG